MPRGTLKRLVDALTNNTSSSVHTSGNPSCGKNEPDFGEKLSIDQFQPCKIVRHGFPNKPSALAYDPLQKLLAIGCYNGSIRIIGQPGVDCFVTHETEAPIIQLLFLANQGALVSVCADDAIHLWNLRQTKPAILHSLLFKRERITCCHIPHQSKWMYIGTDRGNTHLCNVETFTLSGYSINWNKAIVLSQKSHPGHVVSICENPVDENKLLISYNSGFLVLWDLKNRIPDHRYNYSRSIRHTCWHFEGKQFLCCHDDGTLTIWNYRNSSKPQQEQRPHALSKEDTCFPMVKADWLSCRNSDPFIIFSGATSRSNLAKPSVTIMKGRSISILEVDFPVIDFKALVGTPWPTDFQDPTALVVLTENELVVIDLESPDYPAIEMDHAMDIHDSPVTCLKYVPDADTDLIPGLYQVAATKPRREENTKKEWPITGGEWSMDDCDGIPEIFVTGHADGSVRFWDASAVFLKALYKLRTKKIFKREENSETEEDDPFQITHIALCPESRTLVVANISSAVVAYKLETQETQSEITCLNVSPEKECHRSAENLVESNNVHTLSTNCKDGAGKEEHVQSNESDSNKAETNNHDAPSKSENDGPVHHATQPTPSLKVKNGSIKQSAGFQAYLTCLVFENDVDSTCNITYLSLNTSFQLFALGTTSHICIVDMLQKTCLFNMTADALLISMDKRIPPRSPNRLKTGLSEASQSSFSFDQPSLKSPTDSVFSRGSSFSDAERSNPREIVTFLNFAHTYTKKNDYVALPCLWIGTSGGYIFNVMISLPSSCEQRSTQLVVASPSGTVLQMKSSVVYCTFLNSAGQHVSAGAGNWREHCNAGHVGGTCDTPGSDRTNQTTVDKQFMVVSSERDAKVFTLPSQVCMHSVSFHADVGPVVQATVDTVHRGTFLACFTANGYILVYGLPCLNLLMEAAYLPANDVRISNTFCFGLSAQAVYLASHSEIQRMTYSVDTYESMQEVIGHLFIPCESPERPNPGFFKGLFGGGHAALDREELFGEDQSGKPSRGVAQHVPGTGGSSLEGLRSTSSGLASDMQRLRMQAQERGEKLSDLEDKTRQMNESAMKFSSGAHSLMLKYKSKKWYQM